MLSVMYRFLVLSFFAAVAVGQMTQTMRDRILRDHNEKRRQATNAANMIELRYDMALEQVAQAYLAKGCAGGFQHNPNRGCDYTARGGTNGGTGSCASVGENWYSGYTDNTTGVDVVIGGAVAQWTDGRCSSWASPPLRCNSYMCSEKQNFYQTGTDDWGACTQTSGQVLHYTQAMWATTTHVGCGYTAACGTLCDYAPAGNINLPSMGSMREQNIWKIGSVCSSCPSGYSCNAGLCSATSTPVTTTSAPSSCSGDTTNKPTNGNIGTCGTTTAVGSTCTQTCNTGYTLTSGSLSRQCTTGGAWATTTAVCSAVTCAGDSSSKPTNGNPGTCSTAKTYTQTCQMACNSGYTLTSGSLTRTCGATGAWSSASAVCSATTTPAPATTTPAPATTTQAPTTTRPPVTCAGDFNTKPTNGNPGTCSTTKSSGQTCQMACNSGYTLTSGSLTRTCGTTGTWSSASAVCSATTTAPVTTTTTAPLKGAYCTSGPQSVDDTEFGDVRLNGVGDAIVDSDGCPGTVGPTNLTSLSASLALGQSYTLTVVRTTCGDWYLAVVGAWIDWNQNGLWEASEILFPFSQQIGTLSFSFTVPTTSKLGKTRFRLQVQEISAANITTIDPCAMFSWGDTKDYSVVVISASNQVQCSGDPTIKPVNGVAGTCLNTMSYGQVCQQRCNTGYILTAGSLESMCGSNGKYAQSTAVCSATAAVTAQIAAATNVCLPDNIIPPNGGPGTCADIGLVGSTCTQTCNSGFTLRMGTSLERECSLSGYGPSTAICE